LKALREQVSYVPQDVFLFSDTVLNNIGFGINENSDSYKASKAARQAHVENEIKHFSKGYDTMIGERGVTLSGGQKQRISIARALIKEPQIVIFDDCLSAVDTATENTIIKNLNEYLSGKTSIIITHRIFRLFTFDQIFVLDNGAVIEQGTHESLMNKGGYYAELYNFQGMEGKDEL
jgi:ATP-binding cassette subfamily B protein